MKISVYNFKGGVGKTLISLNLALTLDYAVVTNDVYSPLEKVLDEKRIMKIDQGEDFPEFPEDYDIVFDLGGHIDQRAVSALKQSQLVLVPVTNDFVNIQVTIDTLTEVQRVNEKLVVVANHIVPGDYEDIISAIKRFFDFPVFPIKKSKCLPNIFKERKSVAAMVEEGGLKKFHYAKVAEQFDSLIEYIRMQSRVVNLAP